MFGGNMAKSGSNNIATILAISSLIGVGILTKMLMKQNSEIMDMGGNISQLRSELALIQGRPVDPNAKPEIGKVTLQAEEVKNPYIPEEASKKLNMKKGYYCLAEKTDQNAVIYFDGEGSLKAWGETDGTAMFVQSKPPETIGSYTISSFNIFVKVKDQQNGRVFVLRGAILNSGLDGIVTDFDLQNELFTTCPF